MTHIDLTNSNDLDAALRGVRYLADTLPSHEAGHPVTISICLTAKQASVLTLATGPLESLPQPAPAQVTDESGASAGAAPAAPVAEAEKPKTIRRTKEETAAGLSIEEAREFRSQDLPLDQFVAELRADAEEEAGAVGPETDPLAGLGQDAAELTQPAQPSLEDQPGMGSVEAATSAPPEQVANAAVTKVDLQSVAGELLKLNRAQNADLIRATAKKYNVGKLSDAPQEKWSEIHTYLSGVLEQQQANASLV